MNTKIKINHWDDAGEQEPELVTIGKLTKLNDRIVIEYSRAGHKFVIEVEKEPSKQ